MYQNEQELMKRNVFLFSLLLNTLLFAQNFKQCGSTFMRNKALADNPQLVEQRVKYLQKLDSLKQFRSKMDDEVRIIPVVIHVIHTGGYSNISEAQILDAMEIINEDYNKLNSDTTSVIDEFQDIIADVSLEFKLAKLDPDGNCTKGITRTYSELTNDAGENVKGLITWDPSKYLNVWVVSEIGIGAGGYSYYPGEAPNNDANAGIVVLASQFGGIEESNGNNSSKRTMTHEIGHYLNLSHTWGNSNENSVQENCNYDDGISDTPETIGTSSSCNLEQATCGSLDNVQNYMDYSSCSRMFTNGQKYAMRAALESGNYWENAPRNNLWTTENLTATGLLDNEDAADCIAIIEFDNDSEISCTAQEVQWTNQSYNYSDEVSFEWSFPGATPNTSNEENPVIVYNQTGTYDATLTLITSGGSETKTINNAIYISNSEDKIIAPSQFKFESNQFPINPDNLNANWYLGENFQTDSWDWNSASSTSESGSIRIRSLNFEDLNFRKLYSPIFDLSNVPSPCFMYYDYAYAKRSASSDDLLRVRVSEDCGVDWLTRITKNTENLVTVNGNQTFVFIPDADEWETQQINISPWSGRDQIQFLVEFSGERGNYLYLDNIRFAVPYLGTEELIARTLNLEVFPNPTSGNATIKFNLLENQKIQLELTDVLGMRVYKQLENFKAGTHQINLKELKESLNPGMYFISCTIGNYKETIRVLVY